MSTQNQDPLVRIISKQGEDPLLNQLLQKEALTDHAVLIVLLKQDPESKKVLAKRIHDLTAALRTLRFVFEALESGYRFDDDKAADKIKSVGRAVSNLERETELINRVYSNG